MYNIQDMLKRITCAFFVSLVLCVPVAHAGDFCDIGKYEKDGVCTTPDDGFYATGCIEEISQEYSATEYLESTGVQYIDTGLVINHGDDYTVEYVMELSDTSDGWTGADAFMQLQCVQGGYTMYRDTDIIPGTGKDTVTVKFANDIETLYLNGVEVQSRDWTGYDREDVKLAIMGLGEYENGNPTLTGVAGKLYSVKIWQGENLRHHFIPAIKNTDTSAGLFDLITGTFFGPGSATQFMSPGASSVGINVGCTTQSPCTAGYYCRHGGRETCPIGTYSLAGASDCTPVPDGSYGSECRAAYQHMEYIQSSGTQYIDTGFVVNQGDSYAVEYILSADARSNGWTGANAYLQLRISSQGYSLWNSGNDFAKNASDVVKVVYENKTESLYINGEHRQSRSWASYNTPNVKLLLLKLGYPTSTNLNGVYVKLYAAKVWHDGELVRNYIPVRDVTSNTVGMLDTISHKFYPNAGTGQFTASASSADVIGFACANVTLCEPGFFCKNAIKAVCNVGTWSGVGASECATCVNAPANSVYLEKQYTNAQCPWKCTSSYALTAVNTCSLPCNMGVRRLMSSAGHDIRLFATKNTSPAIAVGNGTSVCYADLLEGAQPGGINMLFKNKVYHMVK